MSEPTEALVVRVGWQIEGLPATIRRAGSAHPNQRVPPGTERREQAAVA